MEILQPKLRFSEFKSDWLNKTFLDIVTFINGKAYKQEELLDKGTYPVLRVGNFFSNNNWYYSDLELDENKYCDYGDLLYAWSASFGPKIWEGNKTIYHYHIWKVLIKENNYKSFIYHLLDNETLKMKNKSANGFALLHITKGTIESWNINVPSLEEQTRIANFLSAVDEKLNLLKEKKTLLVDYKKGIMQKIFNQEIRFKDDNGNNFEDWEEKTFGEMSTIRRGASPRPITDARWFDENSTIGWVRISDVTKSNKYLLKTEQYLSEEGVNKSRLVTKGNLIMSICATIGKPIYTDFDVCIHDGFVVFENLKGYREYFYYYLQYIQKNWYNYGQPGTQVNLNSDIVSNELLLFPSIDEQTKIANFLSAIDEKIELVSNQIQDTQEYKKGLLQQMFV